MCPGPLVKNPCPNVNVIPSLKKILNSWDNVVLDPMMYKSINLLCLLRLIHSWLDDPVAQTLVCSEGRHVHVVPL